MEVVNKILEQLGNPMVVAVAGFVLDMVLRLVKTEKPVSVLHVVASICRVIAKAAAAVADFADKVLGQRLVEAAPEQPKAS